MIRSEGTPSLQESGRRNAGRGNLGCRDESCRNPGSGVPVWMGPAAMLLRTFLVAIVLVVAGCHHPENAEHDRTSLLDANRPKSVPLPVWFVDETEERGVQFVFRSGHTQEFLFPEIMGGGGALFDFDNDGDLDLYCVQGGSLQPGAKVEHRSQLFRNNGHGRFEDISAGSGADIAGYGMGVAAADVDRDGWIDLYVTRVGPNVFLKNQGDGTFVDRTETVGAGDPGWGTSCAFFDANGDRWPDLYVCNYVGWSLEKDIRCKAASGVPDYCGPNSYADPRPDVLYLNRGDGTLFDATAVSGIGNASGNGLGVVPADFNGDDLTDLFVANDNTRNLLWINQGEGRFQNQALEAGCAVDRDGMAKAGMGTCTADPNHDGKVDVLVVNMYGQSDSFFENRGGYFVDQTARWGLATPSRSFTRFGAGMHDFNHDGWLDLFLANGRVTRPSNPPQGDEFAEANLLLAGNSSGRFERVSDEQAGAVSAVATSRAAVFGDVDNDGDIDVVVVNKDSPAQLLINRTTPTDSWIGFHVQDAEGHLALGAVVEMELEGRKHRRDVNPHYSYLASNDPRVHFGLGSATGPCVVRIRWPSGTREQFGPLEAGAYHTLKEGQGTAVAGATAPDATGS